MEENCPECLHKQYPAFLSNRPLEKNVIFEKNSIEKALANSSLQSVNPLYLLEQWREFVSVIFYLERQGELISFLALILKKLRHLISLNRWHECQILIVYEALARHLAKIENLSFKLVQLDSGACPLDAAGIWTWGQVPQPVLHAEMGIILSVYSLLTKDKDFFDIALRMADWQKNTLDAKFKPFDGLFTFEGSALKGALLVNNYVLFDLTAKMAACPVNAAIAAKLKEQMTEEKVPLPSHLLMLSGVCGLASPEMGPSMSLPSKIEDVFLSLAGHRGKEISVVTTLCGGGSGLGCFHANENSVLSFGPQHMPLGECSGYGIIGGTYRAKEGLQSCVFKDGGFLLEGASLMVSCLEKDRYAASEQTPTLLLDSCLEYSSSVQNLGELKIGITLHEIEEREPLAFSFFVKSSNCSIDSRHFVKPKSLNRYSGASKPVSFLGKSSSLCIDSEVNFEEMHVIPLGGGDSFWGADYLLAFILPTGQKKFSWTVRGFALRSFAQNGQKEWTTANGQKEWTGRTRVFSCQ